MHLVAKPQRAITRYPSFEYKARRRAWKGCVPVRGTSNVGRIRANPARQVDRRAQCGHGRRRVGGALLVK
jgi:hypothetical protein